ncbi:non-ribosomal peptide synthetase [Candidatus Uabimicrobium amorphum]|uniref:Surfactin synthase subunit 1 n=1 Tax=Uabimicrobium amorphum TaxID=2596890 RepID=A0A5S9F129_UABAM|nr:non-ribosomal peptide synthetase [Candidatus Uabimicrobium amorphum]BBM81663.1 surfactin synthase subunit 1 [Candidatus Uabimicrobium amorphum]
MKSTKALSIQQQRIFIVHQLCKNIPLYNISLLFRVEGDLDIVVLEKSIQTLIARHDALRTKISTDKTEGEQLIFDENHFCLPDVITVEKSQLDRAVQHNISQPFHFDQEFLFRVKIFKVGEKHILSLVFHHIVVDGWSLKIITKELFQIYSNYVKNQVNQLPQIKYHGDVSRSATVLAKNVKFWQKQLAGMEEMGSLIYDFPVASKPDFTMARQLILMKKENINPLRTVAQQNNTTLFTVLLSLFQIIMFRYTQHGDVIIGTVSHGRKPQMKGVVGFFVNTLPIRCMLHDQMSVTELIRQTHLKLAETYCHEEIPFHHIVQSLDSHKIDKYFPVIQVIFTLQKLDLTYQELGSIKVQQLRSQNSVCPFPLMVLLRETHEGIQVTCNYHSAVFRETTITTILKLYEHLLLNVSLDSRIGDIGLFAEEQKQQFIAVNCNRKPREYQCVHHIFEDCAQATPDRVAVSHQGICLSYWELNNRANQLALVFTKKNIGKQPRVLVILERSIDYIVTILAILKMGGTYISISADTPHFRQEQIIRQSKPQLIVTRRPYLAHLPKTYHIDRMQWTSKNCLFSSVDPGANAAAYIMFTSGSTGKPKGIAIPHCGIVRLVKDVKYVDLENTRVLQMSNLAFDASTFEIWGPLLNNSCCVIFPKQHFDIESLKWVIEKENITTMWLTSSLFNVVIDDAPQILACIKELLVGGEALSVAHITKALKCLPNTTLINGYGPTENTVFTCCYKIPKSFAVMRSIPIGKPINNTQVYILDQKKQPVLPGVAGELYVSGDGLAIGYLEEELTKEKFVPNPFVENDVMYASGDICRYLADGNIEYIGRKDRQIKLRGYRIELSEIEHYLQMLPNIRKAFVKLFTTPCKFIVAYLYLKPHCTYCKDSVKQYLKHKLPDFMIPQQFILIDTYPVTTNGKVDYKALPEPQEFANDLVSPQGELEQSIAKIWEAHLPKSNIGRFDDFFEIGGDSLKAMRILPEIESLVGKKLDIENMFHYTTIQSFCEFLNSNEDRVYQHLVPIKVSESGDKANIFCVHTGHGEVFSYYGLAQHVKCNFYGIRASSKLYPDMETMAQAYVDEIKKVQPQGPYYIGGACIGTIIAVQLAKLLNDCGDKVATLFLIDPNDPHIYEYSRARVWFKRTRKACQKMFRMQFAEFWQDVKGLLYRKMSKNAHHRKQIKIRDHLFLLPKNIRLCLPVQKVAFFHVKDRCFIEKWKKICPLLQDHVVPGNHQNVFLEPQVAKLAGKLNLYIESSCDS